MSLRLLVVTAVLILASAAPAAARVVAGQGMAGVKIAMTEAEVVDVLGQPDSRKKVDDDFGTSLRLRYASHGGLRLILRQNAEGAYELFEIRTNGVVERTKEGVGVGTRERLLRRKLDGEKCETVSGYRTCTLGSFTLGHVVTVFRIRKRHVSAVTVGRVVD